MKKLWIVCALVVGVAACQEAEGQRQKVFKKVVDDRPIQVWIDTKTKCQYVVYTDAKKGGIMPRLDQHGKPVCGGK